MEGPPDRPHDPALEHPLATPALGSADPRETHLQAVEEPSTTGTLFFTLFLLMIIAGFWAVMYYELLHR